MGNLLQPTADYTWKVIVIGDPSVGKTTLMLRYTEQNFKELYMPTVGVQVSQKLFKKNDRKIKFNIWDIAGQTKFAQFRKIFYEAAFGYLLVFDVTARETLLNTLKWQEDYIKNSKALVTVGLLIGNKIDLKDEREISEAEALRYAKQLGLDYLETSALTGANVDAMFNYLFNRIYKKIMEKKKK